MIFCERKFVKTMQTAVSFKQNDLFWLKNVEYLSFCDNFQLFSMISSIGNGKLTQIR